MAELQVVEGKLRESSFTLGSQRTTIGRDLKCDVVLPGSKVSRRHALIVKKGEQFFIQDTGSHRGTKVNGRLFTGQLELKAGDRIRVHGYVLRFVP